MVLADLSDGQAEAFAGLSSLERLEELRSIVAPEGELARARAVRGPLCSECRVSWEDVHADTTKPWPCPGKRPKALGGPLAPAQRRKSRQERRAEQRKASEAAKRPKSDSLVAQVNQAIARERHERSRRESAREAADGAMEELGKALAGVDDLEGFLA